MDLEEGCLAKVRDRSLRGSGPTLMRHWFIRTLLMLVSIASAVLSLTLQGPAAKAQDSTTNMTKQVPNPVGTYGRDAYHQTIIKKDRNCIKLYWGVWGSNSEYHFFAAGSQIGNKLTVFYDGRYRDDPNNLAPCKAVFELDGKTIRYLKAESDQCLPEAGNWLTKYKEILLSRSTAQVPQNPIAPLSKIEWVKRLDAAAQKYCTY